MIVTPYGAWVLTYRQDGGKDEANGYKRMGANPKDRYSDKR